MPNGPVTHHNVAPAGLATAHTWRVTALAVRLGAALGLPPASITTLETGAQLHDIGKTGVPTVLLAKSGPLTRSEFAIVRRHVIIGDRLARAFGAPEPVRLIIRHHHERWDGAGYPDGLRGEAIPLLARIVALADAYDCMTGGRPYRAARSAEHAVAEITRCAGGQFDPQLAIVFVARVVPGFTTSP